MPYFLREPTFNRLPAHYCLKVWGFGKFSGCDISFRGLKSLAAIKVYHRGHGQSQRKTKLLEFLQRTASSVVLSVLCGLKPREVFLSH